MLPVLRKLAAASCMERHDFGRTCAQDEVCRTPIYVVHTPRLHVRRQRMLDQLRLVGASDITVVQCAERSDLSQLSGSEFRCLHPEYARTMFSSSNMTDMQNGTLSLATKHMLAYEDMLRRGLASAIVLEDDTAVPRDLWARLARCAL